MATDMGLHEESYCNSLSRAKVSSDQQRQGPKPKINLKLITKYRRIKVWPLIPTNNVFRRYDHPNIVGVFDFCEDQSNIYIALELMLQGDLEKNIKKIKASLINKSTAAIEAACANIIHQIILAIAFLHKQGCIHRDLKPANVLLKYERVDEQATKITCKVTDFGFAVKKEEYEQMSLTLGTAPYMAPEIIAAKKYDQKVDIWAIGVIAYEILFDRRPFAGIDRRQVFSDIRSKLSEKDYVFKGCNLSEEARLFINDCLEADPQKRPSAQDLLSHPWITQMHRIQLAQSMVTPEQWTDVFLNVYTFKRCSTIQSSVLSILAEHRQDPAERDKIIEIFHKLDKEQKGYLVGSDMKSGMELVLPYFWKVLGKKDDFQPNWDSIVHNIDTEKTGKLLSRQFIAAATNRMRFLKDERCLSHAFSILDKDADGYISLAEFKEAFGFKKETWRSSNKVQSKVWAEIDAAFKQMDVNGDNKVSFMEFKAHMLQLEKKGKYEKRHVVLLRETEVVTVIQQRGTFQQNLPQNPQESYHSEETMVNDETDRLTSVPVVRMTDLHVGQQLDMSQRLIGRERSQLSEAICSGEPLKVIVIGDSGVGKTCLINRLAADEFDEEYKIAASEIFHNDFQNNCSLLIWDQAAGSTVGVAGPKMFYNKASAVLICFSLADKKSFENCLLWNQQLEDLCRPDVVRFLVGLQADTEEEEVEFQEINTLMRQCGFDNYFQTSAKSGKNVQKLFSSLALVIKDQKRKIDKTETVETGRTSEKGKPAQTQGKQRVEQQAQRLVPELHSNVQTRPNCCKRLTDKIMFWR